MRFRVVILRRAELDLQQIINWIEARSPIGAAPWLAAFEKFVERLATAADTLALAEEDTSFDQTLRQGLFRTRRGRVYRAVFVIVGDEARILRIRGPGQAQIEPDANNLE